MANLEKKILLPSQEKRYEEVTRHINTNYELQEVRMTKIEVENASLHALLVQNTEKCLAQSYKSGILQQQIDELQAKVNTNQIAS
jgi:hypothetical protein